MYGRAAICRRQIGPLRYWERKQALKRGRGLKQSENIKLFVAVLNQFEQSKDCSMIFNWARSRTSEIPTESTASRELLVPENGLLSMNDMICGVSGSASTWLCARYKRRRYVRRYEDLALAHTVYTLVGCAALLVGCATWHSSRSASWRPEVVFKRNRVFCYWYSANQMSWSPSVTSLFSETSGAITSGDRVRFRTLWKNKSELLLQSIKQMFAHNIF